jgi:hypothetical protein
VATPTPGGEQLDAVRALQHVLYRAAKGRSRTTMRGLYRRSTAGTSPGGRRPGGRNNGAPGIDRTTLAKVEEYRESVCPITWTWSRGPGPTPEGPTGVSSRKPSLRRVPGPPGAARRPQGAHSGALKAPRPTTGHSRNRPLLRSEGSATSIPLAAGGCQADVKGERTTKVRGHLTPTGAKWLKVDIPYVPGQIMTYPRGTNRGNPGQSRASCLASPVYSHKGIGRNRTDPAEWCVTPVVGRVLHRGFTRSADTEGPAHA